MTESLRQDKNRDKSKDYPRRGGTRGQSIIIFFTIWEKRIYKQGKNASFVRMI